MITVDTTGFDGAMMRLRQLIGPELAKQVLPYEGQQFLKALIKVTPPFSTGSGSATDVSTGKRAVGRDIARTMRPISSKDFTKSKRLRSRIEKLERNADLAGFNKLAQQFKKGPLEGAKAVLFSKEQHQKYRNREGRVRSDKKNRVLGPSEVAKLAAYRAKIIKRVGFLKGGWKTSAAALVVNLPAYAKNQPSPGGFIDYDNSVKPFIQMTNGAVKLPGYALQVRYALGIRERFMRSKIKRLIDQKAVNLGFTVYGGTP